MRAACEAIFELRFPFGTFCMARCGSFDADLFRAKLLIAGCRQITISSPTLNPGLVQPGLSRRTLPMCPLVAWIRDQRQSPTYPYWDLAFLGVFQWRFRRSESGHRSGSPWERLTSRCRRRPSRSGPPCRLEEPDVDVVEGRRRLPKASLGRLLKTRYGAPEQLKTPLPPSRSGRGRRTHDRLARRAGVATDECPWLCAGQSRALWLCTRPCGKVDRQLFQMTSAHPGPTPSRLLASPRASRRRALARLCVP